MKNLPSIPSCEECIIRGNPLFRSLNKDQLNGVNFEKGCNYQKRGNIIYQEGNRTSGFYCVHKGVVKLFKTGVDGREQIIRFVQKGDIFGYRSVLSGELACTTAKVIEDAVVCFIPSHLLFALVRNNAGFSMEIMQLALKELGDANRFIINIAQKTVRERLAEVLLLLKETFGVDSDNTLSISLTREELANIVGTATESVIRLLSEFKLDGYIELNGRKIKIISHDALARIANVYE